MINNLCRIGGATVDYIAVQPWPVKLLYILIATMAPIAPYIHFLVFLLFLDAFTAIWFQYKGNRQALYDSNLPDRKVPGRIKTFLMTIESRKLRTTFEKLVAYVIGIIVCFFFDKIVLQITPLQGDALQYFSVANISVVLITSVELTSILANLSKITKNPVYGRILRIFNRRIDEKMNDYETKDSD